MSRSSDSYWYLVPLAAVGRGIKHEENGRQRARDWLYRTADRTAAATRRLRSTDRPTTAAAASVGIHTHPLEKPARQSKPLTKILELRVRRGCIILGAYVNASMDYCNQTVLKFADRVSCMRCMRAERADTIHTHIVCIPVYQ